MTKTFAATLAAIFFAGSAQGSVLLPPAHIYEFSGTLADAQGGPSMVAGLGASFTGSGASGGMRFAANQGPLVSNAFANPGLYSIEMFFSLDDVSNYRRLVDFKNGSGDSGLYLNEGRPNFYGPSGTVATTYAADQMVHFVLTRDASEVVRGYGQGVELFSFNDTSASEYGVFTGPGNIARFFRDNGTEASSGFVDFIRLYDRALTGSEVATLYGGGAPIRQFAVPVSAVPEPGTWASLILGFGMVGSVIRRRKRPLPAFA